MIAQSMGGGGGSATCRQFDPVSSPPPLQAVSPPFTPPQPRMVSSSTRRSPAIMPKLLPASQDSAATRAESALRIAKQNEDAVTPAYLSMNLMWLLRLRGKKASELESSLVFETLTWTEISPQATAQLSRIREAIRNKEKVNGGEAVTHLSFRLGSRGNMISKLIADFVLPEDHLEPLLLPKGEEPEPGRVAPPRKNVPKARAKPPTRPTTKNLTSPTKEETPSTRLRTRKHGTILDDDQASESGVDKKQPRKEGLISTVLFNRLWTAPHPLFVISGVFTAAPFMAISPHCRPRPAPARTSLSTVAPCRPLHGPLSAMPPLCMALSPHCRPVPPLHGPLCALPPPCRPPARPTLSHPAWPTLRTAAPCMPRQGLISTVLFNRLWTAPHPLFVIYGVFAGFALRGYCTAAPFMALSPHCRLRAAPCTAHSQPPRMALSALPPPFMASLRTAAPSAPFMALSALPPLHGPLRTAAPSRPCTDLSQLPPPSWPSLRTAASVPPPARPTQPPAWPLSALPPPSWPSLRTAAPVPPLHGPLSTAAPCMALSPLPPPSRPARTSLSTAAPSWPSLRTAASVPPPARPTLSHPAWPSLRTAAPCMPRQGLISTVLFNRLWTAPHPLFVIYGVCWLRSQGATGLPCRPPSWPSLRTAPSRPCMASLSTVAPCRPCMASLRHAAPLHGPLRTAATLHDPLCALPPPCRPCTAHSPYCRHPHGPLVLPPCMPRQGLISTVLFNRLWTAPHPLFVISGCWLRSQEATGLHSLRTAAPCMALSPLFPNTWSPHRPLSISGRMAALSAAPPGLLPLKMFADVDYSQFDSVQEAVAFLNRRIRETPPTDEPIHQILNRSIIEHEVDVITAPSTPGADDYHQNPNDPFADSGTLSEEGSPSSPSSTRPTASVGGVPTTPGMPGPRRPSTPLDEHGLPVEHKAPAAPAVPAVPAAPTTPPPQLRPPPLPAPPAPPRMPPRHRTRHRPQRSRPIKILDDDVPSPPKPIAPRKEPKKEPKKAPVKEEVPKKVPGPAPPPRRKAKLQRPEDEAEAEADQDEAQREKKRPEKKHAHGDEIEVSSGDDETKAKIKRHRQATEEPAPGDQGQLTGPSRTLLEDGAGLLDVVLSQTPCQRAQLPLALIDPCPNPARPLSCDRMKAIFGYFHQFGWAALFSLSVQKAAAGERFEVVDGSHRYAVARLIVDPNRVSELPAHITQDERQELRDLAVNLNKEYPKVKNHLANELVNVVLLENMDEDALLVFQATCNAMTADDSFGSSGYDVLLNAPQLYSLTNPDLPARLKPALKALHFPDSKDAYINWPVQRGTAHCPFANPIQSHLTRSNLWRIFETKDVLFNQFLIARMLQPDFNGSTLATPDLPKFKLPIRQAEQAWLLMARHDEAALARHEPHPLGHPVLPEYSEELGAVGCPFSGLNWDDLVHLPNYILDLNIFDGPHLPGDYARLPHGTRRYLINTKLTVLVEKLTADHEHPRREMKLLKTIDRNLREAREHERQERLEREVDVSALVAKSVEPTIGPAREAARKRPQAANLPSALALRTSKSTKKSWKFAPPLPPPQPDQRPAPAPEAQPAPTREEANPSASTAKASRKGGERTRRRAGPALRPTPKGRSCPPGAVAGPHVLLFGRACPLRRRTAPHTYALFVSRRRRRGVSPETKDKAPDYEDVSQQLTTLVQSGERY
ncbi:hypothetical protein PAPYR_12289 [Paratrimastix pyriformis]|uniref:ParB/Sulfiredoxin domain-containing protein n=1 Tax=Paratrimastix pyriformis TaxID=342808 RepID=A0ABQ8U250_9EUKA|nr:hypothetical protein PAPYR_12289 [Paratrimastix pyriformis]